jgi:hypothetical protein
MMLLRKFILSELSPITSFLSSTSRLSNSNMASVGAEKPESWIIDSRFQGVYKVIKTLCYLSYSIARKQSQLLAYHYILQLLNFNIFLFHSYIF